uniref:Predicted protein n=1 Tax=Hordeum vulgare subsp. vulgare TaxID=112509 RepID=F2DY49_HORVV|nr:predicted protein [Hordeum vulgare subsp. vulgare]
MLSLASSQPRILSVLALSFDFYVKHYLSFPSVLSTCCLLCVLVPFLHTFYLVESLSFLMFSNIVAQ